MATKNFFDLTLDKCQATTIMKVDWQGNLFKERGKAMASSNGKRNRYPGKCSACHEPVAAEQGYLLRDALTWRWQVYCEACYAKLMDGLNQRKARERQKLARALEGLKAACEHLPEDAKKACLVVLAQAEAEQKTDLDELFWGFFQAAGGWEKASEEFLAALDKARDLAEGVPATA